MTDNKVVCRIDANRREVIVFTKDENSETTTQKRYKAVLLSDVEFGAGMIRGSLVETYENPVTSAMPKRGYYNKNHTNRYVDKYTKKVLTDAPCAMLSGSSVLYAE